MSCIYDERGPRVYCNYRTRMKLCCVELSEYKPQKKCTEYIERISG